MINAVIAFFNWYWSSWFWLVPVLLAFGPILIWQVVKRIPKYSNLGGKKNVRSKHRG